MQVMIDASTILDNNVLVIYVRTEVGNIEISSSIILNCNLQNK